MTRMRPFLATLMALSVAAVATPLASAAPAVNGEFDLTGKPAHLAQGPDGNVWVALTDSTSGNDVAKVTPAGAVQEFDLPGVMNTDGIVTGPDGKLWVTHSAGGGGVFRFSPADPTGGTNVPVSDITDARAIVIGPDNNLWTVSGDKAISITTDAVPVVTPHTVIGMAAHDIARGGDGILYIADGGSGAGRVVGLTTTGTTTFYATGGGQGIAAGPGNQIAYTNPVNTPEQIGRITPGTLTPLITDQPNIDPTGIVAGNDGAYWIANFGGDVVTRFTTDGVVTSLPGLSAGSGPRWIATGPGNTLWVGLETAKKVARVTGVEPPPTPSPNPNPKPPAKDTTAPRVSALSLARRLHRGASTTIHLKLSEAATLTLRFDRVLPGRRSKARTCVAPRRSLRKARHCQRFTRVGTLTRHASAGAGTLAFDGRVGRHKLALGAYRLTITARDAAGNTSRPARVSFTVIAAKRKVRR